MSFLLSALLYALYAAVVALFLRVLYFQFRLILHIWRFIWDAYGFAVWRAFSQRGRAKAAFDNWRSSAPVTALRAKLRRALVHLGIGFVLFFAATLTISFTAPHLLDRGLFAQ